MAFFSRAYLSFEIRWPYLFFAVGFLPRNQANTGVSVSVLRVSSYTNMSFDPTQTSNTKLGEMSLIQINSIIVDQI